MPCAHPTCGLDGGHKAPTAQPHVVGWGFNSARGRVDYGYGLGHCDEDDSSLRRQVGVDAF